jgi:hypothetical protein
VAGRRHGERGARARSARAAVTRAFEASSSGSKR